jgi:hypothetical protein
MPQRSSNSRRGLDRSGPVRRRFLLRVAGP